MDLRVAGPDDTGNVPPREGIRKTEERVKRATRTFHLGHVNYRFSWSRYFHATAQVASWKRYRACSEISPYQPPLGQHAPELSGKHTSSVSAAARWLKIVATDTKRDSAP